MSSTKTTESKVGLVALILSVLIFLWPFVLPASLALGITAMQQNKAVKNNVYKLGRAAVIISVIGVILIAGLVIWALNSQPSSELLTDRFNSIDLKIATYHNSAFRGDGYYPGNLSASGLGLTYADHRVVSADGPALGKISYEALPVSCKSFCTGYKLQLDLSPKATLVKTVSP